MKRSPLKANKPLTSTKSLKKGSSLKKSSGTVSKQKKPSVSKLKKKADILWSVATRYRFMNKDGTVNCVTCGACLDFKKAQCGHFMSRRFNATRFSEENTAPQCYSCNVMRYGEQYKYGLWLESFYGAGTAKRLQEEAAVGHQFTVSELQEIIDDCVTVIDFYLSKK